MSASAEVQFAVTFGHKGGSGSVVLAGNETETIQGATEAIYKQFAGLVLPEAEISGGFKISATGTGGVHYANQTPDDYIYVLVVLIILIPILIKTKIYWVSRKPYTN